MLEPGCEAVCAEEWNGITTWHGMKCGSSLSWSGLDCRF
jgi:hypothetical protein